MPLQKMRQTLAAADDNNMPPSARSSSSGRSSPTRRPKPRHEALRGSHSPGATEHILQRRSSPIGHLPGKSSLQRPVPFQLWRKNRLTASDVGSEISLPPSSRGESPQGGSPRSRSPHNRIDHSFSETTVALSASTECPPSTAGETAPISSQRRQREGPYRGPSLCSSADADCGRLVLEPFCNSWTNVPRHLSRFASCFTDRVLGDRAMPVPPQSQSPQGPHAGCPTGVTSRGTPGVPTWGARPVELVR